MKKLKNEKPALDSVGQIALKPEEGVRQRIIRELRGLGWSEAQLRWKPEWLR